MRSRSGLRSILAAFLLFAWGGILDVGADPAQSQCAGVDMLAEFERQDPDLYASVMENARRIENTEALLWRIDKAGSEPSYLFGTVHLSDPRVTTLSEQVKSALAHSKALSVEVADLSEPTVAKAMTNAADLLLYKDGRTLKEQLTPDEFQRVQDIVSKSGMPGEFAGMLKPWLVNMLLSVSDCERRHVSAGAPVLDIRLAEEAQKLGIPVNGLETIEQQLTALADVPDDQQIQMLKAGLAYASRTDDMMETLVQLYLKRQIGAAIPFQLALAAKAGAPASAFEGFKKLLLVDRNAKMRDGVLPLIENGGSFIAVGALHLPGKTGLVQLLRAAGYTLTPIE